MPRESDQSTDLLVKNQTWNPSLAGISTTQIDDARWQYVRQNRKSHRLGYWGPNFSVKKPIAVEGLPLPLLPWRRIIFRSYRIHGHKPSVNLHDYPVHETWYTVKWRKILRLGSICSRTNAKTEDVMQCFSTRRDVIVSIVRGCIFNDERFAWAYW